MLNIVRRYKNKELSFLATSSRLNFTFGNVACILFHPTWLNFVSLFNLHILFYTSFHFLFPNPSRVTTEQFNQTTGTSEEPQYPPKGESVFVFPVRWGQSSRQGGHWDRIGPRTQTLDTPTKWSHSGDPSPILIMKLSQPWVTKTQKKPLKSSSITSIHRSS